MASRPSDYPDWDLNDTDTAAPSSAEVDDGWVIDVQPDRQIFNWLKRVYGLWIRWFDQVVGLGTDLLANNTIMYQHTVIPAEFTGDPPAWAGTRSTTVPSSWFTGAAVINGFRHGPVASPAATLPNSSDVYVDLGQDGTWDFNAVANGAGAPALAANHVRFFTFVTNGINQITGGTYFQNGFRYASLSVLLRATLGFILSASRGISFHADSNRSVVIHDGLVEGGNADIGAITPETWAAKEILAGRSSTVPAGLAGNDSHWWAYTINARWTGTQWARRVNTDNSFMFVLHKQGLTILRHDLSDATPWANTIAAGTWTVVGQYGLLGEGLNNGNFQVQASGNAACGGSMSAEHFLPSSDPSGTPDANGLYESNVPKAWCCYTTDGSTGLQIESSFNVDTIAWNAGTDSAEITLLRALSGADNVAVIGTYNHNGLSDPYRFIVVRAVSTTQIDVQHILHNGTLLAQNNANHGRTYVAVFGLQ